MVISKEWKKKLIGKAQASKFNMNMLSVGTPTSKQGYSLASRRDPEYHKLRENEKTMIELFNSKYGIYGKEHYHIWLDSQPEEYKKNYCNILMSENKKLYTGEVVNINKCLEIIKNNALEAKQKFLVK